MDEIVSFGEWVQARRNQLGLTRAGLAHQVGCSPVTIKKIERDERRPSLQIAELLAEHLQIPEADQDNFMRRARGEFVPTLISPEAMTLAEARAPIQDEDVPKHNLPPQTTPFFGREQELADIASKLADPNCRLLTILGGGGMGKTRLAIEAGQRHTADLQFTDGVTFVALAPIGAERSDSEVNPLAGAVADALKISFHAQGTPEEQLFTYLRRKEMLIIFDNFEHLVETAVFLSDLLQHAPDIKILTTSRERLNLQEEWLFALQGLSYSEDETSAIQLFAQRAKQVKADFDLEGEKTAVFRICQLVEGMPLGLELAAAWVLQLNCQEIANEIEAELDFLTTETRNVPDRHRSIRAIFSYSWEKLSEKERDVLQKLSVFRGGFERTAAKAVAGASLSILGRLVGKSLLSVGENGRYHIHELLRQFAEQELAQSPEIEKETRNQHCQYYLTLVANQASVIKGPHVLAALKLIELDIDNIRIGIRWALNDMPELFNNPFGFALWQYCDATGWVLEGEKIFDAIASRLERECMPSQYQATDEDIPNECVLWIQYLTHLCTVKWRLDRLDEARKILKHIAPMLSTSQTTQGWTQSWCLTNLGVIATFQNDFEQGLLNLQESGRLAEAAAEPWFQATSLIALNQVYGKIGQYEKAKRLAKRAGAILNEMGERIWSSFVFSDLGRIETSLGNLDAAEQYQQECYNRRLELSFRIGMVATLNDLGHVARLQGQYEKSRNYYQQCIALANELNLAGFVNDALWSLGNLAVDVGDFTNAKQLYQASSRTHPQTYLVGGLGFAAIGLEAWEEANYLFREALKLALENKAQPRALDALVGLAHIKVHEGNFENTCELLSLVNHHPASSYEIREKANRLREGLEIELPPERKAEAEARGRELDLWETAVSLLAEQNNK